jgi:DNA-binding response OmpR family regulator
MLGAVESAPPNASKHPGASSILVVDDENASGELVATLLRSQGYSVRLVNDGKEALPIVARGGVDLLLLDLMMSRMDGVEICAHVRNQLCDHFLPIVITTSLNDRESRIRAMEAGADDVLVKPIDGLELLVRIDSLLRTRWHIAQLARERDRASEELHYARISQQNQQRTLRSVESASEAIQGIVERQRRALELAKKRVSGGADVRDELARCAQLNEELEACLSGLSGANTGTVVRVSDDADGTDAVAGTVQGAADGRSAIVTATK